VSIRLIISDSDSAHAADVRTATVHGYDDASFSAANIEIRIEAFTTSLAYAVTNSADMVVRSDTGLTGYTTAALAQYPTVICVVPLGSNTYAEIATPTSVPAIVVTGAGDTQNRTAYGPALEFWDDDYPVHGAPWESSYSNGIIAGKLLRIKDYFDCGWERARDIARTYASGAGTRTDINGYGQIDLAAALASHKGSHRPSSPEFSKLKSRGRPMFRVGRGVKGLYGW
jgi:hypothetical protein